jgi:GT2 family glycosyltransferase
VSPKLSIIIVNWNTAQLLSQCLLSIQADPSIPEYETFVVDNASTDNSVSIIKNQFPWVNLIENQENVGFARANNQALQKSSGKYLLLLNSDTELLPQALATLTKVLQSQPQIGAVGPRLLNTNGTLQPSCYPMLSPQRELWRLLFLDYLWRKASYPMNKWDLQKPHEVDVIMGACLLIRREVLDNIGLLDESYFMYTEEVDFCYRLQKARWELRWIPMAQVIHHGGASSKQKEMEMYLQLYKSKFQFYSKFGGMNRANLFIKYLKYAYLPRYIIASLIGMGFQSFARKAKFYKELLQFLPSLASPNGY